MKGERIKRSRSGKSSGTFVEKGSFISDAV